MICHMSTVILLREIVIPLAGLMHGGQHRLTSRCACHNLPLMPWERGSPETRDPYRQLTDQPTNQPGAT